MNVLQLLASENFITFSKVVARLYGVNAAILLGAMCSYQNAFEGKPFYKEQSKIAEDTCLSVYEIQQATKVLKENGIIEIEKKGLPAKNYYFIVEVKLSKILTTGDAEIKPLEAQNLDHYINNNINNKKETNKIEKENINTKEKAQRGIDDIISEQEEKLQEPLKEFVKMRKAIKKPLTAHALDLLLRDLNKMTTTINEKVEIINQSIKNGWQGFYSLKETSQSAKKNDIYEGLVVRV